LFVLYVRTANLSRAAFPAAAAACWPRLQPRRQQQLALAVMSHLAEVQAFLQQECFHTLYIDGAFVPASGGSFDTIAPASEQVLASCPKGSAADMEAAVAAARVAFDQTGWAWTPASERADLLRALAVKLADNEDIIAKIESLDMVRHSYDLFHRAPPADDATALSVSAATSAYPVSAAAAVTR